MPNSTNQKPKPRPRPRPNPYLPDRRGGGFRLGCKRDIPDFRDLTPKKLSMHSQQTLASIHSQRNSVKKMHMLGSSAKMPTSFDLTESKNFTDVEDQKNLGSCTANAVIGLVEYLVKSSSGSAQDHSRIFLYKVTRNLLGDSGIGDSGAYIRDTIKAMRLFGVVPEKWWPYDVDNFDDEPDAYIYSMAQNFQAIDYVRLDTHGASWEDKLLNVKRALLDGFPSAFGFWVPNNMGVVTADTPTMPALDTVSHFDGGHAVLAVGYDDKNRAIKFRNSWGSSWGEKGYAWIPYEYLEHDLAFDFWTIFNQEWVDLEYFN